MDRLQAMHDAADALNRGEFDAAAEMLADDVVWKPRLAALHTPELIGRAAVLQSWRDQFATLGGPGGYRIELLRVDEIGGGAVLADVRVTATTTSGVTVEDTYSGIWTLRRDKVVRVDHYDTREQALDDVA